MAETTDIEWTDGTFNPWIGCTKVSPACANCYAERDFDTRRQVAKWGDQGTRVVTSDANWRVPIRLDRKAAKEGKKLRVFCASLADVFEDWEGEMRHHTGELLLINAGQGGDGQWWDSGAHPEDDWGCRDLTMQDARNRLYDLIDETPNLIWLLLTKRPENFRRFWDGKERKNVWLGATTENQRYYDERIHRLIDAREEGFVSKIFISAEPLIGPVRLGMTHGVDWVITGGESGPGARACDPDWFRLLRDDAKDAGADFHFKQWGEFDANMVRVGKKNAGRILDGVTHDGVPSTT